MLRAAAFLFAAVAVSAAEAPKEKPAPKPGTIEGKFLGPDGKPLVGVTVRVFDQNAKPLKDKPSELPGPVAEPKTDKDGKFSAAGIKPGLYYLGVSEPTRLRGHFIIGGVKPFKLGAGAKVDVGTVKTEEKDLRPNFLKDR
jgi:hypothetical protein